MKKKIISLIAAAIVAASFTCFTVEAKAASTSTITETGSAQGLTFTYTADKYRSPSYEYPGAAKVGDNIHISFAAQGGVGNITYSYRIVPRYGQYIKTISETNLDSVDFVWTPTAAQLYQIDLVARDEAGNEACAYLHYSIADVKDINVSIDGDYLTHPDKTIQGYAVVGQDIKLTATSDMTSDYEARYIYKIDAIAHGTSKTVVTTDGKYTFTPTGEDLYRITVTAEDFNGNVGSSTVQYVISHPLTLGSYTANDKTSSSVYINQGDSVDLKASANGGALAGYIYTYDIIPGDGTNAQRVTSTQGNGNYTFTPSAKGQYLVKVTVKDEQGTTVSGSKEIFVR